MGNDYIVGGRGRDMVSGGMGKDTYVTGLADFEVATAITKGSQYWTLHTPDGDEFIEGIERFVFTTKTLAFDIGANQIAGEAYRVYQAALDQRVPDKPGLGYWIRELDAGHGDLAWVANNFIISNEFKLTYGSPETVSDTQFITLLYNNVLHRNPDTAGLAFWQGEIANGFSRARTLASFWSPPKTKPTSSGSSRTGSNTFSETPGL